jgi:phosphoribosylaminoimidazolecarboxamide formyltransferase/IMP cyclohydrolase
MKKEIKNALISVYNKDGLEKIAKHLHESKINIYSTGGTSKFIKDLGIPVNEVEDLTSYPSILGGRVKTLHPKVFGGILARRDNKEDLKQLKKHEIPQLDLIIVDLYPFKETVKNGGTFEEIVEKIDIGGVSLIRAAAKNFNDTVILCKEKSKNWFVDNKITSTTLEERMNLSSLAFKLTTKYDSRISNWMESQSVTV